MANALINPAANRVGFIGDFVTGYLAKATALHSCTVAGGTDVSWDAYTPADGTGNGAGYAVSRFCVVTKTATGHTITAPTGVSATSIGTANAIIAQSDDSLRNNIGDAIPVERLATRNRNILFNTTATKVCAVYMIVNADDVRIIPVAPATGSVTR